MKRTTYELKYCERCGALGLRRSDSVETYCEPCGQILINYSYPSEALRRLRFRRPETKVLAPLLIGSSAQAAAALGRLQ